MKRNKLTLSIITACVIALPLMAMAYTNPTEPGDAGIDVDTLISNVMGVVWAAFAAIVIILFIFAGVRFLTAGGQPEKIQEARTAAIWGVVGVIVVVLAYSIFAIATSIIGQ